MTIKKYIYRYVCVHVYLWNEGWRDDEEGRPELYFHKVLTLLIKNAADVGQVDTVKIGLGEQLKG